MRIHWRYWEGVASGAALVYIVQRFDSILEVLGAGVVAGLIIGFVFSLVEDINRAVLRKRGLAP